MKIYAVTIKPQSAFGTPLKGDTIFGHFCWQTVLDESLLQDGFDHWLDQYPQRPFAVFSSAWPKLTDRDGQVFYCLPKPAMPAPLPTDLSKLERVGLRKTAKKQKWLVVPQQQLQADLDNSSFINDQELFARHLASLDSQRKRQLQFLPARQQRPIITAPQAHNSIDRRTISTGNGFDPFTMENSHYLPGLELVIFVGIEEDALSPDLLKTGLTRIGQTGYGRDASTGLGRFAVTEISEINWPGLTPAQGCYTLAPCVPEAEQFSSQFALPFTRFGRHGSHLALSNKPFKNPIVMADEGAVFIPKDDSPPPQPFIGKAITGVSLAQKRTVAQGYSLYLPISRRNR